MGYILSNAWKASSDGASVTAFTQAYLVYLRVVILVIIFTCSTVSNFTQITALLILGIVINRLHYHI